MPLARKFVLLCVFMQTACAHAPRGGIVETKPPETGTSPDKLFDDGKPELPSGITCLSWPMGSHRWITATFKDPHHPFVPGKHDGTDIQAPVGTAVLAPVGGVVTWTRAVAKDTDAAVAVTFGQGWVFEVHHLSQVEVTKGQTIVPGERLGLSGGAVGAPGSGPWTTGAHLHLSVSHDGAYVNAAQYFCP